MKFIVKCVDKVRIKIEWNHSIRNRLVKNLRISIDIFALFYLDKIFICLANTLL